MSGTTYAQVRTSAAETTSATERLRACWCGSGARDLLPFSDDYRRCPACQTLVSIRCADDDLTHVSDNQNDLYGSTYWFEHQVGNLGLPTIEQRSRTDLYDRVLHWTKALLRYRRPPGKLLELGCAHGGFVYFASVAGFDACGLELSPRIVEFASRSFGVPVLQGPIEDQNIQPGSLDVITAMDVLEHLSSPVATLERCASLLRNDGLLYLQTPRYPSPASFSELQARNDRFLSHLSVPREHLYLLSEDGIRRLLQQVGFEHVVFEKAVFDHYDMFVVASRTPFKPLADDAGELLLKTPTSRLLLALLDADRCYHRLKARLPA